MNIICKELKMKVLFDVNIVLDLELNFSLKPIFFVTLA